MTKRLRMVLPIVGIPALIAAVAIAAPASSDGPTVAKLSREVALLKAQVHKMQGAKASKKKSKRGPRGPAGPPGPTGAAGTPGAPGTPATVMFGCVNGDGSTCNNYTNPGQVGMNHASTGDYQITMNRNMAGCAVLATAGQGNQQYATTANQAGSGGLNGIEVFLKTDGNPGGAADGVFRYAVFC